MKINYMIKIGKLYRFFKEMTLFSAIKITIFNAFLLIVIGFLGGGFLFLIMDEEVTERGTLGEIYLLNYFDFILSINYESIFIGIVATLLIIRKIVTILIEKKLFKNKVINLEDVLKKEVKISDNIKFNESINFIINEFSELMVRKVNSQKILNSNNNGVSVSQINYMNNLNSVWLLEHNKEILFSDLVVYGQTLEHDLLLFKQNIKLFKYNFVLNDESEHIELENEQKLVEENKVNFKEINEKIFAQNSEVFENKKSIDSLMKKIKLYKFFSYGISVSFLVSLLVYFISVFTKNDDLYVNSIFLFLFSAFYYFGYQYVLSISLMKINDDWSDVKNFIGYYQGFFRKNKPNLNNEKINLLSLYYSLFFLNVIDIHCELSDEEKIEVAYYFYSNYNLDLLNNNDFLLPEYFMLHTLGYSKLVKLMPVVYKF
jgi:hypothetical protein